NISKEKSQLFLFNITCFSFGSNVSFNALVSGYVFSDTKSIHSNYTTSNYVSVYLSKDGYLVLKINSSISKYYFSLVVDFFYNGVGKLITSKDIIEYKLQEEDL
ncbi:hypothetical protein, partial [Malaciobacter halophilus]